MTRWDEGLALLRAREHGRTLAALRIALGLCVVGSVLELLVDGVVVDLLFDHDDGGYRHFSAAPWLVELLGGRTPEVVWAVVAGTGLSGALLTVGAGGRVVALLCLQLFMALVGLNPEAGGAYDLLLCNGLWLLVLADSTQTASVDCRLRRGRWTSEETVASWPRWLAVFQLALLYLSSGLQKLGSPWLPIGDWSALYTILNQPSWQRFEMRWLAWCFPLTQAATAMVWIFELSWPLVLVGFWLRRHPEGGGRLRAAFARVDVRVPYALFGVAMHLGIWALMDLGAFSVVTLSFYLCLLHPDEWPRALRGA